MKKAAVLLLILVVAAGCERWRHELAEPAGKPEPIDYQYVPDLNKPGNAATPTAPSS